MFNTFMLSICNGADIKVEVANICAVMDILVDQDGGSKLCAVMDSLVDKDGRNKLLCSDGLLGRSRWR